MSQYNWGTLTASGTSGTALVAALNSLVTALNTTNSGTTRPTYLTAGGMWINTTSNPWALYVCTTTASGGDVLVGYINTTTLLFNASMQEGLLSKSVAGGVNVTLTATEAQNTIFEFTGVITANIAVIVPNNVKRYQVDNLTTGNFEITVKTATGTGQVVPQGYTMSLYCNGTNIEHADGSGGIDLGAKVFSTLAGTSYTLSTTEGWYDSYEVTAALTAAYTIIVPNIKAGFTFENNSTGGVLPATGFPITVKTAAGTGVVVYAGVKAHLYCNGVNCELVSDTSGQSAMRPIFRASRITSGFPLPTANTWTTVVLNSSYTSGSASIGTDYFSLNTTTGFVTVKVAGLYRISTTLTASHSTIASHFGFRLVNSALTVYPGGSIGGFTTAGAGYSGCASASKVIFLSANATIGIQGACNNATNGSTGFEDNATFWLNAFAMDMEFIG